MVVLDAQVPPGRVDLAAKSTLEHGARLREGGGGGGRLTTTRGSGDGLTLRAVCPDAARKPVREDSPEQGRGGPSLWGAATLPCPRPRAALLCWTMLGGGTRSRLDTVRVNPASLLPTTS